MCHRSAVRWRISFYCTFLATMGRHTYSIRIEKKTFINKRCRRCMPAHRLRANASARATRTPTRRAAHQRVRRAALTRTLACVHLRLPRCQAIPFCILLLQHMHSHITTSTIISTTADAAHGSGPWPSSSAQKRGGKNSSSGPANRPTNTHTPLRRKAGAVIPPQHSSSPLR